MKNPRTLSWQFFTTYCAPYHDLRLVHKYSSLSVFSRVVVVLDEHLIGFTDCMRGVCGNFGGGHVGVDLCRLLGGNVFFCVFCVYIVILKISKNLHFLCIFVHFCAFLLDFDDLKKHPNRLFGFKKISIWMILGNHQNRKKKHPKQGCFGWSFG